MGLSKLEEKVYNLLDMTTYDVQEWLKKTDIILVPMGSCERHGLHLPLGTDSYHALSVTVEAAKKADVPHTPLVWCGYSTHHMREPDQGTGTITLRGETLRNLLFDIARSLIYHGFNKIVFVNYHGSNIKVADEVLRAIRYQTGAFVAFYQHHFERQYKLIKDLIKGPPEETPGWHAGEVETAMILAYDPKLVKMDRAVKDTAHAPKWLTEKFSKVDGTRTVTFEGTETIVMPMEHYEYSDTSVIGNPFRATKEQGEKLIDRMSTHLADFVKEIKEIKVTVKTREFNDRAWYPRL